MKKLQIFCLLIGLAILTACTGLSNAASKGVDASDDELLATLASLARRGTSAVCDPDVLEKELGIKFGAFRVDKTPSTEGLLREHYWTEDVRSVVDVKAIKNGRYYRGRGAEGASCQIDIEFQLDRLCDTVSDRVQKIMGAKVEYGPFTFHASVDFQNYLYQYSPVTGHISQIVIGQSNLKCNSKFQLMTKGMW